MTLSKRFTQLTSLSLIFIVGGLAACAGGQETATEPSIEEPAATEEASGGADLTGEVLVDGSSTVFPISEAMAEEFGKAYPGIAATVGVSGTGGGFKKFCADETDVTGASRPIKQEEIDLCAENGIEYIELPVAFDGLSVTVSPQNDFLQCLTVEELENMWEPAAQGTITNWNQVRPDFPDAPLGLYGAGTDSGTYDYFMTAIGADGESRGDYTASEDDNVIVQGVASDPNGIGFFGYAYYVENQDSLKVVAIDNGDGCVEPSPETIGDGTYQPLSRPEFIYVKKSVAEDPDVKAFVDFYLSPDNAYLVDEVGYVSLPGSVNEKARARYERGEVGSVFKGGATVGVKLDEVL